MITHPCHDTHIMTNSTDRLSELRNLLDKDPCDAFCMYAIAMEHSNTNRHEDAIAWFTHTIETDPAYCYAWYQKAKCQDALGDTEAAIKTLQDGIENATACGDTHAAQEMGDLLGNIR